MKTALNVLVVLVVLAAVAAWTHEPAAVGGAIAALGVYPVGRVCLRR